MLRASCAPAKTGRRCAPETLRSCRCPCRGSPSGKSQCRPDSPNTGRPSYAAAGFVILDAVAVYVEKNLSNVKRASVYAGILGCSGLFPFHSPRSRPSLRRAAPTMVTMSLARSSRLMTSCGSCENGIRRSSSLLICSTSLMRAEQVGRRNLHLDGGWPVMQRQVVGVRLVDVRSGR